VGELTRGAVLDRPWGQTLSALAMRALTGEVTIHAERKPYLIAFHQGIVVAASSPLQSDAAVRVALTGHLVSSTQVSEIVRKQTASPGREEIEVLAEAARLGPDQAMRLRRRVVAQRAARTFSLEKGEFVVDDTITLPIYEGAALDIRTVVYLGAKAYLSETRLNNDLGQLGSWFQVKPEAIEDLSQFGFGDPEQAVVEPMIQGAALAELERPELDQRMVRAVVYALVCCNMCDVEAPARSAPRPHAPSRPPQTQARGPVPTPPAPMPVVQQRAPVAPRPVTPPPRPGTNDGIDAPTLDTPTYHRTELQDAQTNRLPVQRTANDAGRQHDRASTATDPPRASAGIDAPTLLGRKKQASPPVDTSPAAIARKKKAGIQTMAVEQLIKSKLAVLDAHPDHYALIGVQREATAAQIRTAYFALARQLHPDRLSALAILDEQRRAQRLFAELNTAFAILSDPKRRDEYTSVLNRGGSAKIKAEQLKGEELMQRVIDSEEAYRKGEMALRRDQVEMAISELTRAVELNPEEADYQATLAWAKFCGAPDKMAAATAARKGLEKAMKQSPLAVTPKFYLGRVERMLGKDQDALRYFRAVLEQMPHHVEAGSEVRALESRMGGDKGGGGVFGRSKR